VALRGGGAALVWRLHHALADGLSTMRFARALLWDPRALPSPPGSPSTRHEADQARRRAHLARFFAREFARGRSPFDGRIGARREIAFAALSMGDLRKAGKALAGATLNDAVLSVVGGALGRWIEQHHGSIGAVRVKVPVSLHHPGEETANRDSFLAVSVPLRPADAGARLRAVHAATRVRKAEHDAETMDALLRELRALSPGLGRWCERIERSGRALAVNVSNVPGPREAVSVLGAPVSSLHAIAEIAEHHAVRVSAVSLADSLYLGFCADPELVHDVESLARASELEAGELIAAAESAGSYV
jgi:WS/DGAT C-terminal domain/Wax ester synthase/diacylglycerol acyltransferase catalytic domain